MTDQDRTTDGSGVDELLAADLIGFLDAAPSPYHAVRAAAGRLDAAGFTALDPAADWGLEALSPSYVIRDGSLVAWAGGDDAAVTPMRLVGAHTDSPGLRIRPHPDRAVAGFRQLTVEVYGGALANSWLDRDLGLAGRVAVRVPGGDAITHHLLRSPAVMRVPQLAIHLDREVSTSGLVLNPQLHMNPVWGLGDAGPGDFRTWLADQVGADPLDVLGWDVMAFDVQPSAVIGVDRELLAAPRLDDLACCWAAIRALVSDGGVERRSGPVAVVVLNDHEEVGSTTATGADGAWLEQVLERRTVAIGGNRTDLLRALASSMAVSADMAHATHPNYPERHEPGHWIRAGAGPVIKHNANARYATDARGTAAFRSVCTAAGVAVQDYSNRGDLPCGSTIGPLTAARLALDTVDVGMPMLSMHSARELMATADLAPMLAALTAWFRAPNGP